MPNHVHGIIVLNGKTQSKHYLRGTSKTIGSIVRGFKIGVTKWFRQHTDIYTVWQCNYYERIIRNETEWQRIRKYIVNNPIQWENDENYSFKFHSIL
jgi:REP element-mobilizing transposase RayT